MPLETLRFKTYAAYYKWLKKTSDAAEAREIADHEREHVEEAKKRGYTAVYASQVLSSDALFPIAHAIDFIGKEPTVEDLIAICLAPKNPSSGDHALVCKLRTTEGRKKYSLNRSLQCAMDC